MAYATLEKMPGDGTWAALEAAAVRLAPDTDSLEMVKLTCVYVALGRTPGDETWAMPKTAALRVALDMGSS